MGTLGFIGHVGEEGLGPFGGLDLARLVVRHCGVAGREVPADYVGTGEVVQEALIRRLPMTVCTPL